MKNPILLFSVLLLAGVLFVGCSGLPASIISGDKLTLENGATYWRVSSTTVQQTSDMEFQKGTTRTALDGSKATFTSNIVIKIRPKKATLSAPVIRLVTADAASPNGELRISGENWLCGVSYGSGIVPFGLGTPDVQVKYTVEVLQDGVRVNDGYREITWGGAGNTPQNELTLADGRVKLNNVAMLSQGVPYPEMGDLVFLPATSGSNAGYSWFIGRSKAAFMDRFMEICNSQRWKCNSPSCYNDLRNVWLPQLPEAGGYAATGARFIDFQYPPGTVYWDLAEERAFALITVTVSTELGTLVEKPNVATPRIESLSCSNAVAGQSVLVCAKVVNDGNYGPIETSAQGTISYITGSPKQSSFNAGQEKHECFQATGNVAGADSITFRSCSITSFPGQTSTCVTKTCSRSITATYTCGNGLCEAGENAGSCFADCHCGNNVCDGGETSLTCPTDCRGTCNNNNVCDAGEPIGCDGCVAPPPDDTCAEGNIKLGENCIEPRMLALIGGGLIGLYILFGSKRR